jgi:ABC-2 type transport system permease protein
MNIENINKVKIYQESWLMNIWMLIDSSISLLVYRNLIAALDKLFLIWMIVFPVVYIFVVGYAYSALIGNQGINLGASSVTYTSFLTAGMIGFNAMNGSSVAGNIVWNDKRNGMFQQLLVMPFSKVQYIIGNLITIILIGLASAALIMIIGLPTILKDVSITLWSIPYIVYALVMGSIFFGSFTIILSTRIKSSEGYNVISNGLFLFFAFVSSAFYPAQGLPGPLTLAFYLNPLTYIVDISRAGLFSQVDAFTNIQVLIITLLAAAVFMIAVRSMVSMKV